MPTQAPRSSTTGIRRISFSSIIRQHSSIDVSGVTVTMGLVMQSAAFISIGFRPLATVRHTISRSVTTPIGFLLEVLSTTGISPQSLSTIIRATSGREVSAVQHAGSGVIMSLTFMVLSFSKFSKSLPYRPLVHCFLNFLLRGLTVFSHLFQFFRFQSTLLPSYLRFKVSQSGWEPVRVRVLG